MSMLCHRLAVIHRPTRIRKPSHRRHRAATLIRAPAAQSIHRRLNVAVVADPEDTPMKAQSQLAAAQAVTRTRPRDRDPAEPASTISVLKRTICLPFDDSDFEP